MPRFAVGVGYALYRGPSADGSFHRHAAFQIAIAAGAAAGGEVGMVDSGDTCHRGAVLLVPPMVRHRMLPTEDQLTFFVDPHCAFADRLRRRCGPGITAAPELHELGEGDVRRAGARPSGELDPRLLAAMDTLADRDVPMPDLAAGVGLSPQRLRALARDQLGLPLVRWRLWLHLRRAAEALHEGRSPADAAVAGGFADQAHFTRQMRELIGLTPAAVLPVLRPSSAARDVHRDRAAER
ncbi:AraC family transcriptional regulator [Streptomyces sp. ME19-01-6]|uniref:helix-turn-helix domain-containing protein n=1 Tax=Streptomyces sp. ME19-01-6 TaxID=3028686 RepID=UPI0029A90F98|nr:AraC family transcriptional regulator [Streptomyces sp. ME19-01-6]MDX3227535.1 AraC family transcriptional regulator [Streptomyces sp. ME19-01-6]